MSDRSGIPWSNHCLSKFGFGLRREIRNAYKVYAKAVTLAKEIERQDKEELEALTRFEPFGEAN